MQNILQVTVTKVFTFSANTPVFYNVSAFFYTITIYTIMRLSYTHNSTVFWLLYMFVYVCVYW